MEAVMAEKELSNLLVLVPIRVGGVHRAPGSVIAKSDFANKGDWHDLTVMEPPRLSETDAKIGASKAEKAAAVVPGA
jgi:hypothetical protein